MSLTGSLAAEERRQVLREQLRAGGQIVLDDAAEQFGVHRMTIRRDLEALEREGIARRMRGGATFAGPEEFDRRLGHAQQAKRRIAQKLLPLIPSRASIAFDASSTVYHLADALPQAEDLLVVTYGLHAFHTLQERGGIRVFLTGGERDRRTGSLVGPIAQRALAGFSLSRCFMSTVGVDAEIGTTEPTTEEVEMKLAVAAASAHTVLAVDSGKLGRRSAVRGLALDQIDLLVTELDPAHQLLDAFRDHVEVL